jgi:hypothetical protein
VRKGHFTAHQTNLQSESQPKKPEKTVRYYQEGIRIVGKKQQTPKAKTGSRYKKLEQRLARERENEKNSAGPTFHLHKPLEAAYPEQLL